MKLRLIYVVQSALHAIVFFGHHVSQAQPGPSRYYMDRGERPYNYASTKPDVTYTVVPDSACNHGSCIAVKINWGGKELTIDSASVQRQLSTPVRVSFDDESDNLYIRTVEPDLSRSSKSVVHVLFRISPNMRIEHVLLYPCDVQVTKLPQDKQSNANRYRLHCESCNFSITAGYSSRSEAEDVLEICNQHRDPGVQGEDNELVIREMVAHFAEDNRSISVPPQYLCGLFDSAGPDANTLAITVFKPAGDVYIISDDIPGKHSSSTVYWLVWRSGFVESVTLHSDEVTFTPNTRGDIKAQPHSRK